MKFLPSQLYYFMRQRPSRVNILNLARFLLILALIVTLYSVLFHYIMEWEDRYFSWVTGFYWTLTVMSTLGFGDITFHSDVGRVFSVIVLMSGIIFLLVLLPFTFIEFFYAPWLKAQSEARAPSELPAATRGHVILTRLDAVTEALIGKLSRYKYDYVLLAPELNDALNFYDQGYRVMVGALDDPETYRKARVENALLVATTQSDELNSNVAFTVREISPAAPVIATANFSASVDILQLAGSSQVLQLGDMMGRALARRVLGGDTLAHVIGQFDSLRVAEALVGDNSFVGKTLLESNFRECVGMTILGVWQRGRFELAGPQTRIAKGDVLVLAGSEEQIQQYNEYFDDGERTDAPIIIIGGGRVGRVTGRELERRGLDYRIIERLPERIRDPEKYIHGNAAELEVLERAGIQETSAVVVTSHNDDTNIYLTIYCRRLRPDVQLICRAVLERNVSTLHRAGADFVLSYASMGANAIINLLSRTNILMVAEGLDLFEVQTPAGLAGMTIAQTDLRQEMACTIVAIRTTDGEMIINPPSSTELTAGSDLILIGTVDAENRFLDRFG